MPTTTATQPHPPGSTRALLLGARTLWSPGMPPLAARWGMPVVPCVQLGLARKVVTLDRITAAGFGARAPVWAWTAPGDMRALSQYGTRLIADVEAHKGAAGWKGAAGGEREAEAARALAAGVEAVTSHGYVLESCAPALEQFARAGCVAIPQVYDRDGSADARTFLRRCVHMYRALGFEHVTPLLGVEVALVRGTAHLRAWQKACAELGVNFHVYAYGAVADAAPSVQQWAREQGAWNAKHPVKWPQAPLSPATIEVQPTLTPTSGPVAA